MLTICGKATNTQEQIRPMCDRFLLSWLLDEPPEGHEKESDYEGFESSPALDDGPGLYALHDQAEKALLAVIRISMALHYNDYFLEGMGEDAKTRLLAKLGKREGPVVKLGFGLHAGNAVQGAIGSQRKLDATYSKCVSITAEACSSFPSHRTDLIYPFLHSFGICRKSRVPRRGN